MQGHIAGAVLAMLAATTLASAQERITLPSEPGSGPSRTPFRTSSEAPPAVRRLPPLRVERVEVHALGEGTEVGAAGDVLVTFYGQGFLETSKAPRLELGEGALALDDTMVSSDARQLFIVIPRGEARRIESLRFDRVTVVNPGARDSQGTGRAAVAITPRALVRPVTGAPEARLVFGDGFFRRELVER